MANPAPEILPEEAAPHVAIMATGRSDYPNQINNVLCFPGLFREALDYMATRINEEMKMAAAHAIAECIAHEYLQPDYIIPSVFDTDVVKKVANAVEKAARNSGIARNQGRKKSTKYINFLIGVFLTQSLVLSCNICINDFSKKAYPLRFNFPFA